VTTLGSFPDASAAAVAAALGLPLRTVRRYKAAGTLPFPWAVVWAVKGLGDLGAVDPAFRGWIVRQGQIFAPEGYGFTPGELSAIPIRTQQLRALERERAEPRQLMLTHC
jgi:hypothetical protein